MKANNTLQSGLEVAPARAHIPYDGGSTPPSAISLIEQKCREDEVFRKWCGLQGKCATEVQGRLEMEGII